MNLLRLVIPACFWLESNRKTWIRRSSRRMTAVMLLLSIFTTKVFAETNLPSLGDSASGTISPETEYQLGQTFLFTLRNHEPVVSDPLLYDYLENVIYKLAAQTSLGDTQFKVVIIKNPTLNAFAVPGGVVGVNTGLLMQAESNHELAAVLAHELAHISQRHFARSVEQAKRYRVPMMAALLGSAILMAKSDSNVDMAAMGSIVALSADLQLRFSRENEAEADRIGLQTLANAGLDPKALPDFFAKLQRAHRLQGETPPEFLLTHPITENRIADALNRVAQYRAQSFQNDPLFYLIRTQAELQHIDTPLEGIKRYRAILNTDVASPEAAKYGLVRSLIQANQLQEADKNLQQLMQSNPDQIPYVLAKAELLTKQQKYSDAQKLLQDYLDLNPGNYPLTAAYAKQLMLQPTTAAQAMLLLKDLSQQRSYDPEVWSLLAEAAGKANVIRQVHEARAEYMVLYGQFDEALLQLKYALDLTQNDPSSTARIKKRVFEIDAMKEQKVRL